MKKAPPASMCCLPTTREEMAEQGIEQLDVLLVTGDAYVDHPSFAAALLGRWLELHGYRVGIVAQPRWTTPEDVARMGRPRLLAGVTAGALDSLLAHYTAFRKRRSKDAHTPGGCSGARPNRATLVYAGLVRQAFPGLPLVLGGIEASLRRAAHYDFWTDRLRRPLLLDAKADLLACGMGERVLLELARRLDSSGGSSDRDHAGSGSALQRGPGGGPPAAWSGVPGTAFIGSEEELPPNASVLRLPSYEELLAEPRRLLRATLLLEEQVQREACWAVQACGDRSVIFAPPAAPLGEAELDRLYGLPFSRQAHPAYGGERIPALEMVRWSITAHHGCGGGCSFCSLALHQGRRIASRSRASILAEAEQMTLLPGFAGSISDVGGPTANMWGARCTADVCRMLQTSRNFVNTRLPDAPNLTELREYHGDRLPDSLVRVHDHLARAIPDIAGRQQTLQLSPPRLRLGSFQHPLPQHIQLHDAHRPLDAQDELVVHTAQIIHMILVTE